MATKVAIHELKDHLSSIIATVAEAGEEIDITRHGKVVARLVPPHPSGVILGLGVRPDAGSPTVEDLRWTDEELAQMFDASMIPR